jgi:hypothetical protein
MASPGPITPEPRRFSIRLPRPLWIGLVTVVLVVVAVGLPICTPIYRQQVAIREIEQLGGRVERRAPGPEWLRRTFGNTWTTWFGDVVAVDYTASAVTDADLTNLQKLPNLELLTLADTKLTDRGLDHVQRLTSLRALVLTSTSVSDAGIARIENMPQLEGLGLIDTAVTDAGLERLKVLVHLKDLGLTSTSVTDVGLAHLHGLKELRLVCIERTRTSDEGVAELQRALPGLKVDR